MWGVCIGGWGCLLVGSSAMKILLAVRCEGLPGSAPRAVLGQADQHELAQADRRQQQAVRRLLAAQQHPSA